MISLDTETTGIDVRFGARPYFVTICDENDEITNYDWAVDPYTRQPTIPKEDIEEIKHLVEVHKNWGSDLYSEDVAERHTLILQNSKFDITQLGFVDNWFRDNWPWNQTRDTLIASHLLDSGSPHNLTDMATQYLNINIQPYEDKLEAACQKARRLARRKFPEWALAKQGNEDMPSAKAECWKLDMWLLKVLVNELGYDRISSELEDREHHWDTLLADYANADSYATLHLWKTMHKLLHERDLWEIFQNRMKLVPIAFKMEHKGITLSKSRLKRLEEEYEKEVDRCERICVNIASDYTDDEGQSFELKLPKSGNNAKLIDLVFNRMKVPKVKETKTGNPSLDKDAIEEYCETLPARSPELLFFQKLAAKRKREKALSDMSTYQRYWIKTDNEDVYTLHSNLNITGTAHLRWSCNNPNTQNVSKKEGFNLRYMFGPTPGREWWAMDAQNIELRIPAFESGEKDLIDVFLRPKDPPYFGSYHLVVFDALHPEKFKEHGQACKEIYEATWYQWVKNFNFALIYGCQEKKGDATAHVPGAFRKIRHRFPKIAALSDKMIAIANKTGGIETIPNKSVNPRRGYPIRCGFGSYGKVQPTLPLNYHTSGTAMNWMGQAMIRCENERLVGWRQDGFDAWMIMQVHDELVFDLPKSACPVSSPEESNLSRVKELRDLMQRGGDDINVPTPVAIKYVPESLDKGIVI